MKERPILMNGAMVRATLREIDPKMQTRRVVSPRPSDNWTLKAAGVLSCPGHFAHAQMAAVFDRGDGFTQAWKSPYGQAGDRLWVRETWAYHVQAIGSVCDEDGPFVYAADEFGKHHRLCEKWTPSIHMPRWASRITLEITNVRVERLQDISEADAVAEGCSNTLQISGGRFANENFAHLWWTINGDGSWESNPWVWVIEFKRIKP